MKPTRVLLAIVLTLPAVVPANDLPAGSKPSASPATNATATAPAKTNATAKVLGPVIDGEQFTVRQIIDRQQGGLTECVFIAPAKWRDQSSVTWNYAHHSNPVTAAASAENPANEEAFFAHPHQLFFGLRPDAGYFRPGQNVGGMIYLRERLDPARAFLPFIQQLRGRQPNFRVVGTKDLPELAAALKATPSTNQRGVGIKVAYELNGKPVEEEFYALSDSVDIPYDGPQGRTWQNNWGLTYIHSFRAPAGTLEKRREVFAAIAKSFRPNPAWMQRRDAVVQFLANQFNQQLQAGYDQIAAAGRLSAQISANNDAMIASIDRQLAAARSPSAAASGSGGRSATAKFDDYIRGVDTVDDPYYGTSQHASTERYHWTDGYGSYRHANDPGANPNQTESGNWQLMPATR
jgi:hypothetical protein